VEWGRWKDNIKINLQENDWRTWTGLIWLKRGAGGGLLQKFVLKLRVPKNARNFFIV